MAKEKGKPSFCTRIFNSRIATWEFELVDADECIFKIREQFGFRTLKVLFFTDERFISKLSAARKRDQIPDISFFPNCDGYMDIILDRLKFYRFVEQNRLAPVPKTISGHENPFDALGRSVLVRPNLSWFSWDKRQKVAIVSSETALQRITKRYQEDGLNPDEWCYQEILSIKAEHNISTCGWYDAHEHHLFCTRKLLQHPDSCGNGDVIELLRNPPPLLIEQSLALFDALQYEGPFELEWIYDEKDQDYKIIELNPRFWMQHSIAGALSGQAVIRKYIGVIGDFPANQTNNSSEIRYWVNPLYALFRFLKGDIQGIRYYFMKGAVSPISLTQAIVYALIHFLGKRSL
jgi:predicted ATP-grasp superfamily ATP-dependent carboligase